MTVRVLRVVTPGLLTTVQDLGRPGLAGLGIPRAGALDSVALRLANLAVGNDEGAAGLEMWWDGPGLVAEADVRVCVAGGRFHEKALGVLSLAAGEELRLRSLDGSPRAVLAVAGGIDVPLVLGSRSTSVAAGFGGRHGRRLVKGDTLPLGSPPPRPARDAAPLPADLLGTDGDTVDIRVLAGPQEDLFPDGTLRDLPSHRFRLLPESSRIGFRLGGALLGTKPGGAASRPSEGAVVGSIQVPPDGAPIVLLNEGPPTGGYPKLATVIAADLSRLVRTRPAQRLRLVPVPLAESRAAREATEATIARWR